MIHLPLFPLNTVLFPGGYLSLRIFETRYLDMVCACLKDDMPFGVCLIREGSEVGQPAEPYAIGTLARIVDWDRRNDGLLGITAQGQARFRIIRREVTTNRLLMGHVSPLSEPPAMPITDTHGELKRLLAQILKELGSPYPFQESDLDNAQWVASRLSEVLPIPLIDKQRLLEMDAPLDRLDALMHRLQRRAR